MEIIKTLKENKQIKLDKQKEEWVTKVYDEIKLQLETVLRNNLLLSDKESVTIRVINIEPKYVIDVLTSYTLEMYDFEQLSLDTYKFWLKTIS